MRVLELFSGTGSVGKICKECGWIKADCTYFEPRCGHCGK